MITSTIYTHPEILSGWSQTSQATQEMVSGLSETEFLRKPADYWSVAEHFHHLILSLEPVAKASGAPKLALRTFGKPNRPSRTFDGLVQRYHEKLAAAPPNMAQASGFGPKEKEITGISPMVERWGKASDRFLKGLGGWKEEELDKYLVPHPLLGKLTVREILFFTIFHTDHHLRRMRETAAGERG